MTTPRIRGENPMQTKPATPTMDEIRQAVLDELTEENLRILQAKYPIPERITSLPQMTYYMRIGYRLVTNLTTMAYLEHITHPEHHPRIHCGGLLISEGFIGNEYLSQARPKIGGDRVTYEFVRSAHYQNYFYGYQMVRVS